jgi:hypothetical protein
MTKIAGSGSISQRRGSADLDPDPRQNVMGPQHWFFAIIELEQRFSLCRKCLPALTAGGLSALFEEHVDVR